MKNFIFILLPIIIVSCQPSGKKRLNDALKFAGENRIELEKVLKHYENDSLKLKAAMFLIENTKVNNSISIKIIYIKSR